MIYGNDFTELDMDDADFRTGIDLSKQKLPTGDNFLYLEEAAEIIEKAEEIVETWEESEIKKASLIEIFIAMDKISDGQEQLFFVRKDTEPPFFNWLKELTH